MNADLEKWVAESERLCSPDQVVWLDGSREEHERLMAQAIADGVFQPMNEKKYPNCFFHQEQPDRRGAHRASDLHLQREEGGCRPDEQLDVARRGGRQGPSALRRVHEGAHDVRDPLRDGPARARRSARSASRSPTRLYVVESMRIMTRMGKAALDQLGDSTDYCKGFHSLGDLSPDRRFICTSRRRGRSGRSAPATAATPFSGRNATRCGSRA